MVGTAPAPGHIVITSLLLSLIDHHGAASAELLDLWADQNADDFNLEASAGQSQQSRTLKIGLKVTKNILKALKLM